MNNLKKLKILLIRSKSLLLITITTILLSGGCATKGSFDLKMTIEPQAGIYTEHFFNFGETGNIIIKRLISLGIDSANIDIRTFTDRLILTITKTDTSKTKIIEKLITVPGKIEFWETYENSELLTHLIDANNRLRDLKINTDDVINEQPDKLVAKDTSLNESSVITDLIEGDTTGNAAKKEYKINNPLFSVLLPNLDSNGQPRPSCMIGLATLGDTAKVIKYLGMKEMEYIFPHDLKFYWSRDPYKFDETKSLYELHAIKVTSILGEAPLDGSSIVLAYPVVSKSQPDTRIHLSMNSEGAKIWARMTHDNIDRCIAIVIDGYVRSYPRVMNEIKAGNTEISGNFSLAEAQYLSAVLSSGSDLVPLKLKVAETQITKSK
jgi:SecD/SecF fusion protein